VRTAQTWRERLTHVFGPPRGVVHLEAVSEKPFVASDFSPFETPYTSRMKIIGGLSTVLGTAMLMLLYIIDSKISLEQNLAYSVLMLGFFSFVGQLWMRPKMMGLRR
jgi:hypothetical protein